jgi:hypothetical protein
MLLVLRSGKARSNTKQTYHKGRRYCSDNCRKRASETRPQPSANQPVEAPKSAQASMVASTVRNVASTLAISMTYEAQKSGRAPLKMDFGGYSVVPEPERHGVYRSQSGRNSIASAVQTAA